MKDFAVVFFSLFSFSSSIVVDKSSDPSNDVADLVDVVEEIEVIVFSFSKRRISCSTSSSCGIIELYSFGHWVGSISVD